LVLQLNGHRRSEKKKGRKERRGDYQRKFVHIQNQRDLGGEYQEKKKSPRRKGNPLGGAKL